MNLQKKKRTGTFKGRLKRGLALLMAVLMMVTTPAPGLSLTAHADSSLTPVTLPTDGGGLTTAYHASSYSRYGSGSQYGFDIEGIEDPTLVGSKDPYTGNRDRAVSTTYANKGFQTYVQPYIKGEAQNWGKEEAFSFNIANPFQPILKNGGVATFGSTGIQLQLKIYPSKDQKWILVDYVVHNTKDVSNKVQIGTSADIKLGGRTKDDNLPPAANPADSSKLEVNKRGFHMVNSSTKQTFECMLNNNELGLTPPDTTWVGRQDDKDTYRYSNSQHVIQGVDSGLSYSWTIPLKPLETVTKRVAFGVKGSSYYVSKSGDDNAPGDYAEPFKTIERAIQKIVSTNPGNKAVYIYLQSDYELGKTIQIPAGLNVNILSADYARDGSASNQIYTVTRGPNLTSSPMFRSSDSEVRFGDLILDGASKANVESSQPIVSADSGSVSITSNAALQNNKITSSGMGSAADITGTANLDINYGTITGNETADRGAVNFDSTGAFTMEGNCTVDNNADAAGNRANVYLPDGKIITVNDSLGDTSKIGITSSRLPDLTVGGKPTQSGQEIKVAVPKKSSPVDKKPSPFAKSFFADRGNPDGTGLHTAVGTPGLTGAGTDNDKNTVLRKDGYTIHFQTVTKAGDDPMPTPPVIVPVSFGTGDSVTTSAAPDVPGYKLEETQITQGNPPAASPTLQAAGPTDPGPGAITGTMPGQDVTVTYTYRQQKSQISFDTNGGRPATIPTMTGPIGTAVPTMPTAAKEGYKFLGWSKQNAGQTSPIFTWPSVYPTPAQEIMLFAVFAPDPGQKYDYTREYTDNTGTIVFKTDTQAKAHSVEDDIREPAAKVAGYIWDPASSSTNPSFWPEGSATPVGQFDGSGNFTGKMPAKNLTVHFGYKPDTAKGYHLTVNFVSKNGTVLHDPENYLHTAGDAVKVNPRLFSHYTLLTARLDKGATGSETSDGLVIGVQKPPVVGNNYVWNDKMPNQDVELTYVYTGDGTPYTITENYIDDTAADPNLKNIKTQAKQHLADDPVSGAYESQYGYTEVPDGRSITTTSLTPSNIAFKTGADVNQWSGAMPAGDVVITYHHTRIAGKWADLTYKAGKNGALAKDGTTSSEVTSDGGTGYKASILLHGADDTGNAGYTLQMIQDKHLTPAANPSTHYSFEGWFADTDGDGIRDNGEALIPANQTFPQAATLTASFVKIPAEWMDVHFTTEKGSYVSGEQNQNIPKGTTWSQLSSLPVYSAWTHYVEDGWYTKDAGNIYTRVDETKPLTEGQTYIHRFKPGTDQFAYKTDYSSASGLLSVLVDGGKKNIDDPVAANNKTVQGYTLDKTNTKTDPGTYAFDGTTQERFGSFDPSTWNYSGHMPGQDLTVHYKYTVDTAKQRTLTVKYETQSGVPLHTEFIRNYAAEAPVTLDSEAIAGYTCTSYEFMGGGGVYCRGILRPGISLRY